MTTSNQDFALECKKLNINELEDLLLLDGLTTEKQIIVKQEINNLLQKQVYDLKQPGAPKIITETSTATINSTKVARFVSLVGWCVCVSSIGIAITGLFSTSKMGAVSILTSLDVMVSGLLLVLAGQATSAVIGNSNYTKQLVSLLKEK